MIVFNTSNTAQTFKVIPRIYGEQLTMSITDDSTNISVFYEINNAITNGNYLTFNEIFKNLTDKHLLNMIKIYKIN